MVDSDSVLAVPPLATTAATMPQKASSEPTDRSMPAVRMTKVMPSAISPVIEICRMMLNRLIGSMKLGFSTVKTTISTARNISGPKLISRRATLMPPRWLCSVVLLIASLPASGRAPSVPSVFPRVASMPGISPVMRPRRMVTIRSDTASTSGNSDEIIMMAMPRAASCTRIWCTSALAPTSTPRVGSSTISTFGSRASQRARMTFCWLPPDRPSIACSGEAMRIDSVFL